MWNSENMEPSTCIGVLCYEEIKLVNVYFFCCLMHVIMSTGYSDEMLELVIFALEDLRKLLKEQGSDLMIRFGKAENVITEIVEEVVIYYICLLLMIF